MSTPPSVLTTYCAGKPSRRIISPDPWLRLRKAQSPEMRSQRRSVPEAGLEPARSFEWGILSRASTATPAYV